MKVNIILFCLFMMILPIVLFAENTLQVVSHVDINMYLGTWYEIARYPNSFQKKCVCSWVEYTLRDDGNIQVINKCTKSNGKISKIKGKAWVYDESNNAKLKVRFFWPFRSNYWIIDLGDNYEYAVVSEPKRKFLWILSRTKTLSGEQYNKILQSITKQGFDPSRLIIDPWEK